MKVVRSKEISMSSSSKSLLYGFSVFDTMYITESKNVILADKHVSRFLNSAKELNFNIPMSHDEIKSLTLDYIKSNQLSNSILRTTLLLDNQDSEPTILFTHRQNTYTKSDLLDGSTLVVSKTKRNNTSALCYHKTSNYMDNLLALNEATSKNYDDALFLNHDNHICETSKANIFFVVNNKVYTPQISCGLLPGLTREWVISALKDMEIEVIEGNFTIDEINNSNEIFITNSVMGVAPVKKINNRNFNISESNLITHNLIKKYEDEFYF
jgi:branched-subunit amino acid aminotransferase/4-amino-4-deoxychorismate lyase